MFSDEKGYLVTEMVWEDCSDSELPQKDLSAKHEESKIKAPLNSSSNSKSASAPSKASSKPATTAKEASGSGQKSMMSFFGKK